MLDVLNYQTRVKFSANKATLYSANVDNVGRRANNGDNLKKDREKAYRGEQSIKSINRVRDNLMAWIYAIEQGNKNKRERGAKSNVKLVVLTLTLSSKQLHNDKVIKAQLLAPFLKYLQYNYSVENYFWRAEPQENGNIHFHVLIDKYVQKEKVQEVWNKYQNLLGYVDRYYEQSGKVNPPSTQIQSFSSDEKGINYLLKYLMKENKGRKIEGLQMRVSNKLSHLKIYDIEICKSDESGLFALLEKKSVRKYAGEHAIVYYFEFDAHMMFSKFSELRAGLKYYSCMFDAIYVYNLESWQVSLVSLYFFNKSKFAYLVKVFQEKGKKVGNVLKCLYKY